MVIKVRRECILEYTLYILPEDGVRTWQKYQGIDYDLSGSSDSKILGYWLNTYQVAQTVKKKKKQTSLQCGRPSFGPWVVRIPNSPLENPSILAWRIPWTEDSGRLQFMGVTKSQTWLSNLPNPLLTMRVCQVKAKIRPTNILYNISLFKRWPDKIMLKWKKKSEEKLNRGRHTWYFYIQSKFWNNIISDFLQGERNTFKIEFEHEKGLYCELPRRR